MREDLLRRLGETERTLKDDPYLDQWLTEESRKRSALPTAPAGPGPVPPGQRPGAGENCQNEPAPAPTHPLPEGEVASLGEPEGSARVSISALRKDRRFKQQQKCQNEPAPVPTHPLPEGEVSGLAHSEGFPLGGGSDTGGVSSPPCKFPAFGLQ